MRRFFKELGATLAIVLMAAAGVIIGLVILVFSLSPLILALAASIYLIHLVGWL